MGAGATGTGRIDDGEVGRVLRPVLPVGAIRTRRDVELHLSTLRLCRAFCATALSGQSAAETETDLQSELQTAAEHPPDTKAADQGPCAGRRSDGQTTDANLPPGIRRPGGGGRGRAGG